MKILLLADHECKALWDFYRPERLEGIDLIISCGDLKREYLEFLVTLAAKPVYYVPGNHDLAYLKNPPEGCESLDGNLLTFRGLRIAGLGGCMCYSREPYQYTEAQMARRARRLQHRIKKAGGVDMLVTHAPMAGHGDAEDLPHKGFACFEKLTERWEPRWFVHGHVHMNYSISIPRLQKFGNTQIINAYERYVLEIPEL